MKLFPNDTCLLRREDAPLALRALLAPIIFYAPFLASLPPKYAAPLLLLVFYLLLDTNYILHLHVHRPLTRSRALNLALDLCLGATTGMTASNWRIQHVYGHHLGRDAPFRGGGVRMQDAYSVGRALKYSLLSIWPTFHGPLVEAFDKGLLRGEIDPIDYRWAFCEQCLLLLLVAALLYVSPPLTLFYVVPSFAAAYFGSRYIDYLNHYGCDESDPHPFARSNNCLDVRFNRRLHNFGYHAAHHFRPGAHWTELPRIHAEIAGRIPARCLKNVSWSFLSVPRHFYLAAKGSMP